MKETPKYIMAAALAIMTFAGCGNENDELNVFDRKDSPDFTATIGSVQSRAFDNNWEQGDEIGVSGCNRTNVCYLTNSNDGKFTVKTHGEQIYFQDESEVTFTAYYPWNNLAEGVVAIDADTEVQTNQKSFDFLWAQASGKKDSPNVNFNFAHRMAKVVLTVRPGNGMSFDEVKDATLSLGGFRHTGFINITDGSTMVNGDATANWVFTGGVAPAVLDETESTVTYSLIFFPQEFDNPLAFLAELDLSDNKSYNLRAGIDFTAANSEKDGAQAKNEWVAGRQYNLSLTLHKTDITLSECVINPWNEVNGDEINVD